MLALAPYLLAAALAGTAPGAAAFDRLKALEGTWQGAVMTPDGETTLVDYRLTAAGSALVETVFEGTPHEMVTVYHLDGGSLVLTHYCAAGNQPRMRLDPRTSTKDELHFVFEGGANVDPGKDVHMHELTIRLHPDGGSDSAWVSWKGGRPDQVARIYLKRRAE